jgi:hypothetical protein
MHTVFWLENKGDLDVEDNIRMDVRNKVGRYGRDASC